MCVTYRLKNKWCGIGQGMMPGDAPLRSVWLAFAHVCVPPARNAVDFEATWQSSRLSVGFFETN